MWADSIFAMGGGNAITRQATMPTLALFYVGVSVFDPPIGATALLCADGYFDIAAVSIAQPSLDRRTGIEINGGGLVNDIRFAPRDSGANPKDAATLRWRLG